MTVGEPDNGFCVCTDPERLRKPNARSLLARLRERDRGKEENSGAVPEVHALPQSARHNCRDEDYAVDSSIYVATRINGITEQHPAKTMTSVTTTNKTP